MTTTRRAKWYVRALRVLVLALSLPLMSAGALPLWAQLAGVEGPHVCHCSIEKHDCVCPKCNPDHDDELRLTTEALTGRCGDDETTFPGKALRAVLPAGFVVAAIGLRTNVQPDPERRPEDPLPSPPTPPPRSSPLVA